MAFRRSPGERVFDAANLLFLAAIGLLALYPFVYVLALSVSTPLALAKGGSWLIPAETSWAAYKMVLNDPNIRTGYLNTITRTAVGTVATLLMTALAAYPLSRKAMPLRRQATFFVLFTLLFSGGLVPRYLLINELGLVDTLMALVVPVMLTAFNVIILKNFFQQIPESFEEAARIDGASDLAILFRIFIPLSKPALATIALWTCVMHWNAWFDAMLFITDDRKQVLQIFLQRIVVENSLQQLRYGVADLGTTDFSPEALKAATVVITVLPIIAVYPFLQRFFIKGITLGGIKG